MRFIGAEQVRAVVGSDLAVAAVEHAFTQHVAGRTEMSEPPLLRLTVDARARFQAKAAKVGPVIGVRLAGERDARHVDEGRRMLLYDAERLVPTALIDEGELYRIRVGAQTAVAVARLRPTAGRGLTVVGAGRLARAVVEAVQMVCPFDTVRIHSRRAASRDGLVADLTGRVPGHLEATGDLPAAVATSDVVITITTATAPVLAGDWVRPGTLVVSAGGGWECDAEVYARADRLIVDDWEHCVQVGDLAALHAQGLISREDVTTTLPEVVAGAADPGAAAPCAVTEVVVAVAQGMTILDVALAAGVLAGLDGRGGTP